VIDFEANTTNNNSNGFTVSESMSFQQFFSYSSQQQPYLQDQQQEQQYKVSP
jgi:hypothetical protein